MFCVDVSSDPAFKMPSYLLDFLKIIHGGFLLIIVFYFYKIKFYQKYRVVSFLLRLFLFFLVGLDVFLWYYSLFVIYKFTAIQVVTSTFASLIMYAPSWYLIFTLIYNKIPDDVGGVKLEVNKSKAVNVVVPEEKPSRNESAEFYLFIINYVMPFFILGLIFSHPLCVWSINNFKNYIILIFLISMCLFVFFKFCSLSGITLYSLNVKSVPTLINIGVKFSFFLIGLVTFTVIYNLIYF
jgi:hypothetical protein